MTGASASSVSNPAAPRTSAADSTVGAERVCGAILSSSSMAASTVACPRIRSANCTQRPPLARVMPREASEGDALCDPTCSHCVSPAGGGARASNRRLWRRRAKRPCTSKTERPSGGCFSCSSLVARLRSFRRPSRHSSRRPPCRRVYAAARPRSCDPDRYEDPDHSSSRASRRAADEEHTLTVGKQRGILVDLAVHDKVVALAGLFNGLQLAEVSRQHANWLRMSSRSSKASPSPPLHHRRAGRRPATARGPRT